MNTISKANAELHIATFGYNLANLSNDDKHEILNNIVELWVNGEFYSAHWTFADAKETAEMMYTADEHANRNKKRKTFRETDIVGMDRGFFN